MERSSDETELAKSSRTGIRLATTFLAVALGRAPTTPAIAADDAAGIAFFETKIRPVLVERCHECHSSQAKKLRAGFGSTLARACARAAIAGRPSCPATSTRACFFRRSRRPSGVEPMPPKGKPARERRRRFPPVDQDGCTRPARWQDRCASAAASRPNNRIGGRSSRCRRPRVPGPSSRRLRPAGEPDRRVRLCQAPGKRPRSLARGRPPHA